MAPKLVWFVPALLLLTLAFLIHPSSSDLYYVKSFCDETDQVDLCVASFLTDPHSVNCTNKDCLIQISVGVLLTNTSKTLGYISGLIEKPPPGIVDDMSYCRNIYEQIYTYLVRALSLLSTKSYWEAEDVVDSAQSMPENCESHFKDRPSILSSRNKMVGDLCSLTWELIDSLVDLPPPSP